MIGPMPPWLKMVPNAAPNDDGFWTRRQVPQHHVVARGKTPDWGQVAECPETHRLGVWDGETGQIVFEGA